MLKKFRQVELCTLYIKTWDPDVMIMYGDDCSDIFAGFSGKFCGIVSLKLSIFKWSASSW